MDSTRYSTPEKRALPPNFKSINDILSLVEDDRAKASKYREANGKEPRKTTFPLVNLIGFVKDFQKPFKTRNGEGDWKCTLEILDHSLEDQSRGIKLNVFRSEEELMPVISGPDVVLIRRAKIQVGPPISLLTTFDTEVHIVSPSKIPSSESFASGVPWIAYAGRNKPTLSPTPEETAYAIWAKAHSSEIALPEVIELQEKALHSVNFRHKFSLLRNVKPDGFHDILGEVVKKHELPGDKLTVYLSDYTKNSRFYNQAWGEDDQDGLEDEDDDQNSDSVKRHLGPYGQHTIQLTLFDGHARYVNETVEPGEWILLSNVQIKEARMGGLLEGYLRSDQSDYDGRRRVRKLKQQGDHDDARWKEALGRKRDYWRKFKEQQKAISNKVAGLSSKRKADDEDAGPLKNSKQRRKEKRAAADKKAAELATKAAANFNEYIRCSQGDQPTVSVEEILKPELFTRSEDGEEHTSPFTLRKYRANVRVVDYFPHYIEDFAVGRHINDYEILSDYSSDEEEHDSSLRRSTGKLVWEWQFELLVEDASSDGGKEKLWLSVGNKDAQFLLNMEDDATNLRRSPQVLASLKEQLFKLWGDLEEQKSAIVNIQYEKAEQERKAKRAPPPSSFTSFASSPPIRIGAQPPTDSDSENENTPLKRRKMKSTPLERTNTHPQPVEKELDMSLKPNNKPFACCIKQYGIKVEEEDPLKASAGDGKRWQRRFGLFGTTIQ